MSYIRKKLSPSDKEILNKLYKEFEKIHIPTTYRDKGRAPYHSLKTGANIQKNARQTSFGIINYRGNQTISSNTKKYPHIYPLLKKFIKSHNHKFKFKTVYINRNVICKKHIDSKNTGRSLLIGLGPYTGGKTTLYLGNKSVSFNIKSSSLVFNGSEIYHQSEPFLGTRYSLVFF